MNFHQTIKWLTFVYFINFKLLLFVFNCMLGSPRSTCNSRLSVSPSNISTQDDNAGINNRWTQQLIKSIESVVKKNQIKYSAIMRQRPTFPMKKQKNTFSEIWSNPTKINEQFLLKQLDSLLEEQSMLDEQLTKLNILIQESQQLKKIQTKQTMDHYAFLRSIWKRNNDILTNEDRIDKLNKKVGSIKDQIYSLISQQKKVSNRYQFSQAILVSKKYEELEEKYKKLLIAFEQKQRSNYPTETNQLVTEIRQKQKLISELQKQNKLLHTKLSLEKQKANRYEKQLVCLKKRIHELNIQLEQKEEQLVKKKQQKKYIFTSDANDFTLTLQSSQIKEQKSFKISKTLEEVNLFLAKLSKNDDKRQTIRNRYTIDRVDRESRTKQSRLSHVKGRVENQKKSQDIRAKTAIKTSQRPKIIKSDYREEQRSSVMKTIKPKEKKFKI